MRSAVGRVRGLGAAREGTHHWWNQRLTAGSNLALMSWLLISVARQPAYDYASVHLWLSSLWVAIPMALLIVSVFYHFRLGLQVLIEDYQHEQARVASLVALNFFVIGVGGAALFAVLKVALGAK